jgi:GNAT superfamily N-acetyltransferase
MPDLRLMELPAPFHRDGRRHLAVLEGGHRRLEIAPVGHAVGADRPSTRQLELLAVILADEAARGAFGDLHPVKQPARNDRDLLRLEVDDPELGEEAQFPLLRHDQNLAVGGVEIGVLHRGGHKVDVARHADLRVHVARRGHGAHARQPGQGFVRMRHRVPAVLPERDHVLDHMRRGFPVRQVHLPEPPGMFHRRPDAIAPRPFVLVRRRGKGSARQLLAIKAVVALLRAVHALRKRARQRLGLEVVPEARHVAGMRALALPVLDHRSRWGKIRHLASSSRRCLFDV